jgi:dihydroflavonol-4-reductase
VARWHIAAAEHGRAGERYILGTENVLYPYWFALIARTIGAPAPGLPVPAGLLGPLADLIDLLRAFGISIPADGNQLRLGARTLYFSFEKAWRELGGPAVNMRDSVRDTFIWYREHGFL